MSALVVVINQAYRNKKGFDSEGAESFQNSVFAFKLHLGAAAPRCSCSSRGGLRLLLKGGQSTQRPASTGSRGRGKRRKGLRPEGVAQTVN